MVNIRSPFLATESGIATATTKAFRHGERRRSCASTMVVTTSIKLERMLLHSGATARIRSGMCNSRPRCSTGTRATTKRRYAAFAEPCCSKLTIASRTNSGRGTSQNKKHRGKSERRNARVPKQKIKAAIHQSTNADMFRERLVSTESDSLHLATALIATATASNTEPIRTPDRSADAGDFQSKRVRAALIGIIRRR